MRRAAGARGTIQEAGFALETVALEPLGYRAHRQAEGFCRLTAPPALGLHPLNQQGSTFGVVFALLSMFTRGASVGCQVFDKPSFPQLPG